MTLWYSYTGSNDLGFSGKGILVSIFARYRHRSGNFDFDILLQQEHLHKLDFILYGRNTVIMSFWDNISVKEVTRDNVPRIDYTGGGCPHILAEPQRTNLIPYSEDFSESAWTKTRCTIDSGGHTSPSGESNAFK